MTSTRSARLLQGAGLLGWALGIVAIVGGDSLIVLTLPAGLLFVGAGAAILGDWGAVRRGLHEVQRRWPQTYPTADKTTWWRVYGAGWVFVGVVWAVAGTTGLT